MIENTIYQKKFLNNKILKRFRCFVEERNIKVNDVDFKPLSVSKKGIVEQLESVVKSNNSDDRKQVLKNDLVINSRSDRKGASGLANRDGSVSLINTVLKIKGINKEYLEFFFKTHTFKEEFFRLGKGIHWDVWMTKFNELKNIEIPLISETRQLQIVNFLKENKIKTEQEIILLENQNLLLIEAIINYKYLVPKNSKFKFFNEEWFQKIPENWKIKKIAELFEIRSSKGFPHEVSLSVTQDRGVIPTENLNIDVVNSSNLGDCKLVLPGDCIISLRSADGGLEFSNLKGIVSPGYVVLKPKIVFDLEFYKFLFKSKNFIIELNKYVRGIRDGKTINFSDIKHINIPFNNNYKPLKNHHLKPISIISLNKRKINSLKKKYEFLLNKAFTEDVFIIK